MKSEAVVEIPTRAQMRQRDPGVLRVPNNRRDRAKNEQPDQQIHAGALILVVAVARAPARLTRKSTRTHS